MSSYDVLAGSWQLPCPHAQQPVQVGLCSFRALSWLHGTCRPPAYQIAFRCPLCDRQHPALLSGQQLDLHPVNDPLPPHHDLMSGRPDWDGGALSGLWQQSVRRGRWPLNLYCSRRRAPVAGWPSLLRILEPDDERRPAIMLVRFDCPACGQPDITQLSARDLLLQPSAWT